MGVEPRMAVRLPKNFLHLDPQMGDIPTPCNILCAESTFLMERVMYRVPDAMAIACRTADRSSIPSRFPPSNPR